MSFPIRIRYAVAELFGSRQQELVLCSGLTTFIGPNGSGKTQVLRRLKDKLRPVVGSRKVRYLSAGRMAALEVFRSEMLGYTDAEASGTGPLRIKERLRPESVLGNLHMLSRRPDLLRIVSERLAVLFRRKIFLDLNENGLKVTFSRGVQAGDTYSFVREASGLLQLVTILAALYDDEVGALLLDEPEMSLHPQLQAFLLREIRNVAGHPSLPDRKLVIISTHSPHMLSVKQLLDVPSLVFFQDADTDPLQVPYDSDELQNRKLQGLIHHFGENYRHTFFSSRPLLVEGPSDAVICHALDDRCHTALEASGSQVVPVIGKGSMGIVIRFLRMIGKTPIILADLDGFADGYELALKFTAHPVTVPDPSALSEAVRTAYLRFADTVDRYWADLGEEAAKHPFWARRKASTAEDQAKKRTALAILLNADAETVLAWPHADTWLFLRQTLIEVLDRLEAMGCFILRRGSIEEYYLVDDNPYFDKLPASLFEAEKLIYLTDDVVEEGYDDILRALRFAAQGPGLDLSERFMR